MRALLYLGGGLLIGAGFVHAEATVTAEKRAQEKFDEQLASHKRVLEMAAEKFLLDQIDGPYETEFDLDPEANRIAMPNMDAPFVHPMDRRMDEADKSEDAIRVGGEMTVETKLSDLTPSVDYLKHAREYAQSPTAAPVSEVSYISEDEYNEEDGRAKEQLLIHMGPDGPMFINEGIVTQDWAELVSPNILVDMYQMISPGEDRVLYVRNTRTDTDYEVIQEIP